MTCFCLINAIDRKTVSVGKWLIFSDCKGRQCRSAFGSPGKASSDQVIKWRRDFFFQPIFLLIISIITERAGFFRPLNSFNYFVWATNNTEFYLGRFSSQLWAQYLFRHKVKLFSKTKIAEGWWQYCGALMSVNLNPN